MAWWYAHGTTAHEAPEEKHAAVLLTLQARSSKPSSCVDTHPSCSNRTSKPQAVAVPEPRQRRVLPSWALVAGAAAVTPKWWEINDRLSFMLRLSRATNNFVRLVVVEKTWDFLPLRPHYRCSFLMEHRIFAMRCSMLLALQRTCLFGWSAALLVTVHFRR